MQAPLIFLCRVSRGVTLLFLLLLAGCNAYRTEEPASSIASGNTLEQSEYDDREYAYLQLPNSLRVLLISDAQAEKAAVSLDVGVGSKDDPAERQGLAHFLEHMLFLGTEKYPVAGEYQAFIAAHGGQHNAYTAFSNTNYFFDINAAELEPALDRFSQFFVSPLFSEKYVAREKHAVESEYRARLNDDERRGLDAIKAVVNPSHPFSQFSVGSLDTLSDREGSLIRDELLDFYRSHYAASRMSLVVLGREPIAQLRELVKARFGDVPDKGLIEQEIVEPLFPDGSLPGRLSIVPKQQLWQLDVSFPVDDPYPHWRAKPLHLIGDQLGHEGEGSLLQYLKNQGWADGLSAGVGLKYRHGALFTVSVGLTELGFGQRDAVVTAIFQAINRLREEGVSQSRYQERRDIAAIEFAYQEKRENLHYVMRLAAVMPHYPEAKLLSGPFQLSQYRPDLYRSYLEQLRPANVLVVAIGAGLDTTAISEHYQTHYAFTPLTEGQLTTWQDVGVNPDIVLSEPNAFIPRDFSRRRALTESDSLPVIAHQQDRLIIWHGDDPRHEEPRSSLKLSLNSRLASDSARHAVLLQLYAALVSDQLNARLYPARLAGSISSVQATRRGLEISVDGFSDRQERLFELLVSTAATGEFDPQRFEDIKKRMTRKWRNADRQLPYRFLHATLRQSLSSPWWDERQRLAAIADISVHDVNNYRQRLLAGCRLELFAYGNLGEQQLLALQDSLQHLAFNDSVPHIEPAIDIVRLADARHWKQGVELPHADAAIAWYVQGANDSNSERALMALTGQIIRSPFYSVLRTEKQYGYVVHAATTVMERVPGLTFIIQSPTAGAGTLVDATTEFMNAFDERVGALTPEVFLQHKQALESQINRPLQNVSQQTAMFWGQLQQGYMAFNRREQLTEALAGITLEQWQGYYRKTFLPRPKRDILIYHQAGDVASRETWRSFQQIKDIELFKHESVMFRYP